MRYASALLKKLAEIMELFIAFMLAIGIILLSLRLAGDLTNIPNLDVYPNYEDLLETCFNLIIGVELIRMVYTHKPGTVFEVLLFAIARQVIIDHSSPINSLVGVLAIAALFATRKYLFVEFDEAEKIIFRANQKVFLVNQLIHIQIPFEENDTLKDVITRQLNKYQEEIGVGACAYFNNIGLRVAKMHNGEISRVEVIKSVTKPTATKQIKE